MSQRVLEENENAPCCRCPQPQCQEDPTGEVCHTASCGWCLHGCPELPELCCLAL
jgi:hypothetical protein